MILEGRIAPRFRGTDVKYQVRSGAMSAYFSASDPNLVASPRIKVDPASDFMPIGGIDLSGDHRMRDLLYDVLCHQSNLLLQEGHMF